MRARDRDLAPSFKRERDESEIMIARALSFKRERDEIGIMISLPSRSRAPAVGPLPGVWCRRVPDLAVGRPPHSRAGECSERDW